MATARVRTMSSVEAREATACADRAYGAWGYTKLIRGSSQCVCGLVAFGSSAVLLGVVAAECRCACSGLKEVRHVRTHRSPCGGCRGVRGILGQQRRVGQFEYHDLASSWPARRHAGPSLPEWTPRPQPTPGRTGYP